MQLQEGSVVITDNATRVVLSLADLTTSSGELLKDVLLVVKNKAPAIYRSGFLLAADPEIGLAMTAIES